MTIAAAIQDKVNAIVNTESRVVSLTEIVGMASPVSIDSTGMDEIAFVYSDGSRFLTACMDEDEGIELETLRAAL